MIKVCGMREPANIQELSILPIDLIGGIFYAKSPRYIGDRKDTALAFSALPDSISSVGVFVNENAEVILQQTNSFCLKYIQLHGNETPEFCSHISKNTPVFKAFGLSEAFDFTLLNEYESEVELFIFDTSCKEHGGSGKKFNWNILEKYTGSTPFLLSGGIGPNDAELVQKVQHPALKGYDLNSGFEISPALKNIDSLKLFLSDLQ